MNLSINRRLGGFTRHLQNASAEELMPFETTPYQDEIGIAIEAYNNMLARTNSLIHENLKVRIQKQNSDYYALQAQIKPHFLYNILENIRMNAEAHNDSSTADMLLLLGRHMRYNLNMSWHPLHLEEELYAARNYLQIHEIRMKDKISYEISIATEIDDVWCPRFLLQPLLENAIQTRICLRPSFAHLRFRHRKQKSAVARLRAGLSSKTTATAFLRNVFWNSRKSSRTENSGRRTPRRTFERKRAPFFLSSD